jgi:hypothetical protein
MRDRDRANKNEIEIFVFSVTSNDFPHDMLLLTFSSNLGSKLWCRRYLHQNHQGLGALCTAASFKGRPHRETTLVQFALLSEAAA